MLFVEDCTGLIGTKKKKTDDIYDQDLEEEKGDDSFLDCPLSAFLGSHFQCTMERVKGTLQRVYNQLYSKHLPLEEMLQTLCLATMLFFMIGGYWLLRSLKDPILTAVCGISVISKAKKLSVFVVLGVMSIYNRQEGENQGDQGIHELPWCWHRCPSCPASAHGECFSGMT